MIRSFWSAAKLQPHLDTAEELGETRIIFRTISDAERFRFACYNLRRRTGATNRLIFELNPEDCSVHIVKAREPEMTTKEFAQ